MHGNRLSSNNRNNRCLLIGISKIYNLLLSTELEAELVELIEVVLTVEKPSNEGISNSEFRTLCILSFCFF